MFSQEMSIGFYIHVHGVAELLMNPLALFWLALLKLSFEFDIIAGLSVGR